MLVAVFSVVTKKWCFFLCLATVSNVDLDFYKYTVTIYFSVVLPLPFVLTTVAVRWHYYGVAETEQSEL